MTNPTDPLVDALKGTLEPHQLEWLEATIAAQHSAAVEVDRRLAARGTYLTAPARDKLLGTTLAWLERP